MLSEEYNNVMWLVRVWGKLPNTGQLDYKGLCSELNLPSNFIKKGLHGTKFLRTYLCDSSITQKYLFRNEYLNSRPKFV